MTGSLSDSVAAQLNLTADIGVAQIVTGLVRKATGDWDFTGTYKFSSEDDSSSTDTCVPDLNANHNATTVKEFLSDGDGPLDANTNHVFELFEYDSPESGALRGEDRYTNGVKVGNAWTECQVEDSFSFAMSKYGTNDALVEMV